MTHKMKLYPRAFENIKLGKKTIEMRLNDEKRSKIQKNDIIEFTNTNYNEKIKVCVQNLYQFKTFEKLYEKFNKIDIEYEEHENANRDDMLAYYSKEEIEKYGVLAIKIKLV